MTCIAFIIALSKLARIPVFDSSGLGSLFGNHSFNLVEVHLHMVLLVCIHQVGLLLDQISHVRLIIVDNRFLFL